MARADWASWRLPGGPVGPTARWAATSNVKGGSGIEEGAQGPLPRRGGSTQLNYLQGPRVPIVTPLLVGRSA